MQSQMDQKKFLGFYKNTVLAYSNSFKKHICRLLEEANVITFDKQSCLMDRIETLYFESKKDFKTIISLTTTDANFSWFYEYCEFRKLYKYSVPLFFEFGGDITDKEQLFEVLEEKLKGFNKKDFKPEYALGTKLGDTSPVYMIENDNVFIKFVLQKSYITQEDFERIDYRYPIVVYIDFEKGFLEIRYDAVKFSGTVESEYYNKIVDSCIDWLKEELGFELFTCEHDEIVQIVNDKKNNEVKMYKQMMDLKTGAAAELKASESDDYVLPFIGEIRELIEENADLFDQAEEAKNLLLQYLTDQEATANYPYIYIKRCKPVESDTFVVKITFDYLSHKYTLLQHLTGTCKDFGMRRMNDVIEYLLTSGCFIKGEKI